jgi:hypothetical protein
MGHPCQKHPSTNTATLDRRNTMSMVRRVPGTTVSWSRYLNPIEYKCRRRSISGPVSRDLCLAIRALTCADEG